MNISKQLLTFARLSTRYYCDNRPRVRSKFLKLKQKQKMFQVDDGTPIFLKKGLQDKLLYNATLFGILFGTGWSIEVFIELVLNSR